MKINKSKFTLTEMIIGIIVLAIIAIIVMLNIKDVKEDANIKAFIAEGAIMQGVTDTYHLKNKVYPTVKQPELGIPRNIDFQLLVPEDVKKYPSPKRGDKYWNDEQGKVWFCTIDSPTNVKITELTGGKVLTWDTVDGATSYGVYSVINGKYKSIGEFPATKTEYTIPNNGKSENVTYLVYSIDKYGLECAPAGDGYEGHVDTNPDVNIKPTAKITLNPDKDFKTDTEISFDWSTESRDPDGDTLVDHEWKGSWDSSWNGENTMLPEGEHKVELRVQDEHGLWSDWTEVTIIVDKATVEEENQAPIAKITMKFVGNSLDYTGIGNVNTDDLTAGTKFAWDFSGSFDIDGDEITEHEWDNMKETYGNGAHTVKLRVQDEHGLWSEWADVSFTIGNRAPIANMLTTMDYANGAFQTTVGATELWLYNLNGTAYTYDPDGDSITNISLEGSYVNNGFAGYYDDNASGTNGFGFILSQAGQYVMTYKVQDSKGLWSEPFVVIINVTDPNNKKPVAVLNQLPTTNIDTGTPVLLAWLNSWDPDPSDYITNVEFESYENGNFSTGKVFNLMGYMINSDSDGAQFLFPRSGTYYIMMRVQDNRGAWSDYVVTEITVTDKIKRTISGLKLTSLGNAGAPMSYWDNQAQWVDNKTSVADLLNCNASCANNIYDEFRRELSRELREKTFVNYNARPPYPTEYYDGYNNDSMNYYINRYINEVASYSGRPSGSILIDGFVAEGTVKNPDGSLASNVVATLSASTIGVTKSVTTDSNGKFKITIPSSSIPSKTRTKYVVWGVYSNHWFEEDYVVVTSGAGSQSAKGLIRTASLSGVNTFAGRWVRTDGTGGTGKYWYDKRNMGLDF